MRTAQLLALALAALLGLTAPSAHAATVGISDGRPALFDSEDLHDINFAHVRLVLPWDAADRPGTWDTWLDRATAQGWSIMIAPNGSGTAPTASAYEGALKRLLDRYPRIDAVEGWNEPNHAAQPTASRPTLAADYYEAARRACATRCTAVAGNLLDAPSMGRYLTTYAAALTTRPAVWGIHNYYDSTYFGRSGIDQMLAITDGPIWLTETGGLVSFQPGGPGTGLLPDERRAADSLRWLFTLTQQEPQLERMYLYGMWQEPWNAFDSALVRVDNTERESMQVVRQNVGPRTTGLPGAPPPTTTATSGATPTANPTTGGPTAANTTTPILRLVGKRIPVDRTTRRATITIRCALANCTGRLTLRAGRWRYARGITLTANTTRTLNVRVGPTGAAALRRRTATATLCATTAGCSSARLKLR